MKVIGLTISGMGGAMKDMLMEICILANFTLEKLTVKDIILGITQKKCMMVNGCAELDKVMVFGKMLKVIHIWANG